MVLLDTPYQLQDAGPAAVGSSRTYLLETQVLPSVECGIEDMLRACTAAAEAVRGLRTAADAAHRSRLTLALARPSRLLALTLTTDPS